MFKKASELKVYPKVGICGPSGSGKTLSSLLIAYGYTKSWDKICVIDTENSGMYYANRYLANINKKIGDYSCAELKPPYSIQRYVAILKEAVNAGFEAIIVDSMSHLWIGPGGILEQVDNAGKGFNAWNKITPEYIKFIDFINEIKACLICTFRAKTEYAQERDPNGKLVIKQIGLAPYFRDNVDYEFMFWFGLNREHIIEGKKDRCGLFPTIHILDEEVGEKLRLWAKGELKEDEYIFNPVKASSISSEKVEQPIQQEVKQVSNIEPKQQHVEQKTNIDTQETQNITAKPVEQPKQEQNIKKQESKTKIDEMYKTLKEKLKAIGVATPEEIRGWLEANLGKQIKSPRELTVEDLEKSLTIVSGNNTPKQDDEGIPF